MSLLAKLRLVFSLGQGIKSLTHGLTEKEAGLDPFRLFGEWFQHAKTSGVALPEAMTLASFKRRGSLSPYCSSQELRHPRFHFLH